MDLRDKQIFIVGHRCLQSTLLTCHLDEKAGFICKNLDCVENVSIEITDVNCQKLILIDCFGIEEPSLVELIETYSLIEHGNTNFALLNLRQETTIEKVSLELGIRGFFYEKDSITALIKGIDAIFSGEVWISRKKMTECLMDNNTNTHRTKRKISILTCREEEILRHLARGGTNDSIASSLCISPHTVRTHIYNIFKKIGVTNRLQASLWAANNL